MSVYDLGIQFESSLELLANAPGWRFLFFWGASLVSFGFLLKTSKQKTTEWGPYLEKTYQGLHIGKRWIRRSDFSMCPQVGIEVEGFDTDSRFRQGAMLLYLKQIHREALPLRKGIVLISSLS